MPTVQTQLFTVALISKLPLSLQRDIRLYAPFFDNLDYMGIEAVTFTSANVTRNATWRDGGVRSIAQNLPRFEYTGETQRGLLIKKSSTELETLTFNPANNLHDANYLYWVQEGVLKRAPADTNPFNSSGAWIGTDNVHVNRFLKFTRTLNASEDAVVKALVYPGL